MLQFFLKKKTQLIPPFSPPQPLKLLSQTFSLLSHSKMAERLASPSATACATLPPAASLNIVAWGVQGGAGLRRRAEETDGRRGTRGDKAGGAEGVAQVAQTSKQHCV